MATTDSPQVRDGAAHQDLYETNGNGLYEERTETRRSMATSEFYVFLLTAIAVLFFTYESGMDSLSRQEGWQMITVLAAAYMVSRGLAKAGTVERYVRRRDESVRR
jgi:hypothetical protein